MQNKISSRFTFVTKKVFPALCLLIFAVFLFNAISKGSAEKDVMFAVLFLFLGGLYFGKKMMWDPMDAVYDCGEYLLVCNRGLEDKVYLSDVMSVHVSTRMKPSRVILRLKKAGKFGDALAFFPASPFTLNPFARNPVGEALIKRVGLSLG